MEGNKLLPLFAAVALGLAVLVGLKTCSRGATQADPEILTEIPQSPGPDADSPAESVRALTAEVANMKTETEALRRENAALVQQRDQIAQQVTTQVKEDLGWQKAEEGNSGGYAVPLNRVETMAQQLEAQNSRAPLAVSETTAQPIPQGAESLMWIEPLGSRPGAGLMDKTGHLFGAAGDKVGSALDNAGSLLHGAGENLGENSVLEHAGVGQANNLPQFPPEPAYTVPRNATLVGSTGMTALLGRIPINGEVQDPYPFKVIVGADNLAANGLEIPGVDGMIFSGEATGDWALSCVRGKVLSVTYVFEDGTIRTLSSDDNSLQTKSQQSAQAQGQQANQGNNANKPLGWISDRRGIPCVSGERITNAPTYLGGRILARAIGAAGQAFARSQTTVNTTPLGGFSTGVTGSAAQFAAGETAAGGADEVSNWLRERQSQSFDVVFVDTGAEVAVHIDQELPIDFEPKGRKLAYARSGSAPSERHGTD